MLKLIDNDRSLSVLTMNRIVKSQIIKPVIPLIGLPLKGYGITFAASKISCRCTLRINYRFAQCRDSNPQKQLRKIDEHSLGFYINSYLNDLFFEILNVCLEGFSDIKCDCELPDIVLFAIATTEIIFNLFNVKKMEYDDYLKTLAVLDRKFWSIDPMYIASIRCAYAYQELCIVRDIHENVRLGSIDIKLGYIKKFECPDLCLELVSPYDNLTTSLLLKYSSHVISKIAQDMTSKGFITSESLKYLKLLYDIETRIAFEILNNPKDSVIIDATPMKPIADIFSIKFYKIHFESINE